MNQQGQSTEGNMNPSDIYVLAISADISRLSRVIGVRHQYNAAFSEDPRTKEEKYGSLAENKIIFIDPFNQDTKGIIEFMKYVTENVSNARMCLYTSTRNLLTLSEKSPRPDISDEEWYSLSKYPRIQNDTDDETFRSSLMTFVTGYQDMSFSCFISHSSKDKKFAWRLFDALRQLGIRCWLDEHQIPVGGDIYEEVDRGIRLWDKLLLCASENSLTSWWVDDEIAIAFEKEQRLTKERGTKVRVLIPLNLDGYLFKWQNGKAAEIRRRLAADFTGWENDDAQFDEQVERLAKALRSDEGREVSPQSRL